MIDIPSDRDSVVKRWYPAGVDLVAAARRAEPAGVFVTGMPGSGVTTVATELDAMAETNLGAPLERAREVDSAAAVLFVVDASAPLGRRALTDLAPALHSTTVAIAVNKTDVHRDWRAVHEVIAQSVAEHVPRAVDVTLWPISAKLAERARIAIDPRMRSALLEESGFEDVLAHLVRALSQSQSLLRDRKYNAAVHAAAAGARHEIVDKARAVTSGATTVALRSERARLADMRDRARTDRATALRSRLQLTRSELVHDLGQSIRQFSTAARESIDAANRAELTHLQQHLGEQLQQAASKVEDRLGDRLLAIDPDGSSQRTARTQSSATRRRRQDDDSSRRLGRCWPGADRDVADRDGAGPRYRRRTCLTRARRTVCVVVGEIAKVGGRSSASASLGGRGCGVDQVGGRTERARSHPRGRVGVFRGLAPIRSGERSRRRVGAGTSRSRTPGRR